MKYQIIPKKFYNLDGTYTEGHFIFLKPFSYELFSTTITCYYEIWDEKEQIINEGKNLTIDVPLDWINDDQTVIDAFLKNLKIELK